MFSTEHKPRVYYSASDFDIVLFAAFLHVKDACIHAFTILEFITRYVR